MCLPNVPAESFEEPQDERRFLIKLRDRTGIGLGIITVEMIVIAESAPEAEMYVRQFLWDGEVGTLDSFDMETRELPQL